MEPRESYCILGRVITNKTAVKGMGKFTTIYCFLIWGSLAYEVWPIQWAMSLSHSKIETITSDSINLQPIKEPPSIYSSSPIASLIPITCPTHQSSQHYSYSTPSSSILQRH